MKIQSSLTNRRGQSLSELSKRNIKKTKNCSFKKRKNERETMNVVQELYETCREVFANGEPDYIPPPADIQRLKSVLDNMKPEHVYLAPTMPFLRGGANAEENPLITYIHVYECSKFSIGIFCLPPNGVIPLHNHPRMTVFNKILFGELHVQSYDWVRHDEITISSTDGNIAHQEIRNRQSPGIRLAKVHVDSDVTAPCDTSVLFPATGGNMHCFRALTPCAILDVLGPPYSESEGRHCTYFQDFPYSRFPEEGLVPEEEESKYAWLEEREKPETFVVDGYMPRYPGIPQN